MRRDLLRRIEKLEIIAGGKGALHVIMVAAEGRKEGDVDAALKASGIKPMPNDTIVCIRQFVPRAGDEALPKYLYSR